MSQEQQRRTYRAPVQTNILWGHKMIHEGNSYFVKDYYDFETSGVQNFEILGLVRPTPDVPHVAWHFSCDRECVVELFENVTFTGTPTGGLENENNNRLIERLPEPWRYSFWTTGFEIEDDGHRMYRGKFGNSVSEDGHLFTNRAEFIGNPSLGLSGTYYLFRFTKESQSPGWLDYYIGYYLN